MTPQALPSCGPAPRTGVHPQTAGWHAGRGVQRRCGDEVLQRLAASDGKPLLLEEFVEGVVHRVNVVGNRYVAAYALEVASVTGDGRHTVTQLMELKNAACRHRPLYPTQRLQLREREQAFLQARGLTPESVLPAGEWGATQRHTAGE